MNDLDKVLNEENQTKVATDQSRASLRLACIGAIAAVAVGAKPSAANAKAIREAHGEVYSTDELRELQRRGEFIVQQRELGSRVAELEELAIKALEDFTSYRDVHHAKLQEMARAAKDAEADVLQSRDAANELHRQRATNPELCAAIDTLLNKAQ